MSSLVFISYARADGEKTAIKLEEWISEQLPLYTFRDATDISGGDPWKARIDNRINDCFVMVVVLTPRANESRYVTYEWSTAMAKNKKVLPLLAHADVNELNMHPKLADVQHLPFINQTVDEWNSIKAHLLKFQAEEAVPPEVTLAVKLLSSPLPDERHQALDSLESIEDTSAIKALKNAVSHPYPDVKAGAGVRLARRTQGQDSDAIPGLEVAIRLHLHPGYSTAIHWLVVSNSELAAATLFRVHNESPVHTQTDLSDALAKFTDPCVIPYLKAIWESGAKRTVIFERLMAFRDEVILDEAIGYVRTREYNNKVDALKSLMNFGEHPKIFDVLFETLREHRELRKSWDREIINLTLQFLEQIGNQDTSDRLLDVLKEPYSRMVYNDGIETVNHIRKKST